ncbi:MAG: carboxypeptidase regulatory-like domain-containing protein [Planctomycetota bacterium]|jgi:peroxiredoxin
MDMFIAGDGDGLVAMLSEGQFESKVFAAVCLGEIGDERALPELQSLYLLAEEKLPEGYTENPFREPIERIKERIEKEPDESRAGVDANETVGADANERAGGDVYEPGSIRIPAESEGVLDFLVVHKGTGRPLQKAELDIRMQREGPDDDLERVTDKQGRCSIEIGDLETKYVRIRIRKERFVPVEVWFRRDEDEVRIDIPSSYTLALEPGTAIGGFVRNEEGVPIEGASVYLYVRSDEIDGIAHVVIRDHKVTTDPNGYWQCDIIPAEVDEVMVRLSHPDYIDDEVYGTTKKPSMEKLRDMTGVMVMTRGVPVVGRVVDSSGHPIEGAVVAQGSDRWGSHYPSAETDANGRFKFKHARPGEMVLTVQAKGYAPDLKEITVREGMEPVEFQLGAAHSIRGWVLDSQDKPIQGAFIAADTWRGHRSINWRSESYSDGYFEWNEAPADEALFDIGKEGYMSVRGFPMSSEIDEYMVVLYPPLRVSGTVVAADSNEPISSFNLMAGTRREGSDRVSWERDRPIKFSNGRYEYTFTYPRDGHLVRIEADGYGPGVSRVFYDDEGDVVFGFRLEKGAGPSGTVYLPAGAPAAGAEVILCTPSQNVYIQDGRNMQKRGSQFVMTGGDGRFSFPAQTEKYVLVVLHDGGYAEITDEKLATEPNFVIETWGQVEGVLRIGSQAGSNKEVSLYFERGYGDDGPRVSYDYSTVTDADGYFAFEMVPPGEARVARRIKLSGHSTGYSQAERVQVKAGETVSVTIGGTGRPVVGRVVVPADYNEPMDWNRVRGGLSTQQLQPPYPDNFHNMTKKEQLRWYVNWQKTEEGKAFIKEHLLPEYPDNVTEMTMEEIRAWTKDWQKTEDGKAFMKAQQKRAKHRRHYAVRIEPDGTFRVEDVSAGTYQLYVHLFDKSRSGFSGREELIGSLNYDFEVPDMNEGASDEPLDIGTLEIRIMKRLKAGDVAASFEAETFDGRQIRLEDYRGKVVLLNFLVSGHSQYAKGISGLDEIYDIFSKEERFVMIGLWLDEDVETAKNFVRDNALRWINCYPTGKSRASVSKDYGVRRLPYTFVIGPDGKILARDPSPLLLQSTLEEVLGREGAR